MADLMEILYPLPEPHRTPRTLLRWWESRRLFYNKVVGATGLITMVGVIVFAPEGGDLIGPPALFIAGLYGLMANICYSLGYVVELVAHWLWGRQAPAMGPLLFRQGLIFSAGLTLFPLAIAIMLRVASILAKLLF